MAEVKKSPTGLVVCHRGLGESKQSVYGDGNLNRRGSMPKKLYIVDQ